MKNALVSNNQIQGAPLSERANAKAPLSLLNVASSKSLMHLKDTGVSAKNLMMWKKANVLLMSDTEEKGWTKFNFKEYAWLMIVKQLREMGLGLKLIERVKNSLVFPTDLHRKYLKEYDEKNLSKVHPKMTIEYLRELRNSMVFIQTSWSFGSVLSECIFTRRNIVLIIFCDGESYFHEEGEDKLFKRYEYEDDEKRYDESTVISIDELRNRSHIVVSLEEILKNYVLQTVPKFSVDGNEILSEEEKKVLEHIRKNDVKQVTIKYKNRKMNLIEVEEEAKVVDLASRMYEHIRKNAYQEITYSTQNGTMTTFIRKTKYKL